MATYGLPGARNFSSLYQQRRPTFKALRPTQRQGREVRLETRPYVFHTTFNLNPRASSIDTPLHSFIPGKHVDHMHPNAIISVAASRRCEELTKEIFGDEMDYVPWMRPGFQLGLAMQEIVRKNPGVRAIMMGQHGFISWQDDDKPVMKRRCVLSKKRRSISRRNASQGEDAKAFGGQKYQTLGEAARHATFAQILPWVRGRVSTKRFIRTIQDDEKSCAT